MRNWKKGFGAVTLSAALLTSGAVSAFAETPELKVKQQAEMVMDKQGKVKVPSFVRGNVSDAKVLTKQDIEKFFEENHELFKMNPKTKLKFVEVTTDDLGMKRYVYQPVIQNIPIDQSVVLVHTDKEGKIVAVNGEFHPNAPDKVKEKKNIHAKKAIDKAWKHIGVKQKDANQKVETAEGKQKSTLTELADLVVLHEDEQYTLAYHVQLQFIQPYPANWQIWVNAETGEVIKSQNKVHEAATTGSGIGVLGDTKSLNTYYYNNQYYLYDTTKPMAGQIETFDANNGSSLPGYYVTDSNNYFSAEWQKAAVDAHYYAGEIFDYFYNKFGRVSYDNQGSDIWSTVHYGSNYNNAAWVGNQMIYGDGDGSLFTYLSGSKDVVAHELTHAVTDTTADLVYERQPGALNESFSDVFGYFSDPTDWLIGEDIYTPGTPGDALRSLSNPTQYGQPDHMDDYQNLPVTKEGDWGGVHINSGIPNKAAYHTINSIGIQKAEQIYYRALTVYLTPNSDFSDARQALIQSAQDLYGTSTANAVASAWDQVGVY
ncbi:M4 family metallopeptidase [Bacillus kexueae]|uniref:M4 family metallopeptidase n=1 Tax=Aeribacillus kexueae TaxID=2078952 RepID=UPI001FAF3C5E|nr:M4 family metallopeptidase [Bacillus kexueae]